MSEGVKLGFRALLSRLALGELALFAGAFEAEFLAFFFAGVTAEKVGSFERTLEIRVHDCQGFGNTETDSFGLAFVATAGYDYTDIEFVDLVENYEGLLEFGQEILAVR